MHYGRRTQIFVQYDLMAFKYKLTANLTLILLAILLAVLGNLKYKQYQSQRLIAIEEENLQQQADTLQKQNDQLTQIFQKINSSDFKEQVARQQLSYKKQDEVVYGFSLGSAQAGQGGPSESAKSNFRKWWDYFFLNSGS